MCDGDIRPLAKVVKQELTTFKRQVDAPSSSNAGKLALLFPSGMDDVLLKAMRFIAASFDLGSIRIEEDQSTSVLVFSTNHLSEKYKNHKNLFLPDENDEFEIDTHLSHYECDREVLTDKFVNIAKEEDKQVMDDKFCLTDSPRVNSVLTSLSDNANDKDNEKVQDNVTNKLQHDQSFCSPVNIVLKHLSCRNIEDPDPVQTNSGTFEHPIQRNAFTLVVLEGNQTNERVTYAKNVNHSEDTVYGDKTKTRLVFGSTIGVTLDCSELENTVREKEFKGNENTAFESNDYISVEDIKCKLNIECANGNVFGSWRQGLGVNKVVANVIREYLGEATLCLACENYSAYKKSTLCLSAIIELYNIPDAADTEDILDLYREVSPDIKWIDNSHALLVMKSEEYANMALRINAGAIKSRRLCEAIPRSLLFVTSFNLVKVLNKWYPQITMTMAQPTSSMVNSPLRYVPDNQADAPVYVIEPNQAQSRKERKVLFSLGQSDYCLIGIISKAQLSSLFAKNKFNYVMI